MSYRMLSRKIEIVLGTCHTEDLSVTVKALYSLIYRHQRVFGNNGTADKIAEFKECCDGLHHFIWHMTSNRREIDLVESEYLFRQLVDGDSPSLMPWSRPQSIA